MFGSDGCLHVSLNQQGMFENDSPTEKELFDHLLYLASSFNMRGSCVLVNRCYLDGKVYDDDDDIREGIINGCMSNYPYNTLQYYYKNKWMFDAVALLYCAESNVIPHIYHNLPPIFKIKRSNGNIQHVIARDISDGIRVRKSITRGDQHDNLYVRVQFSESNPVLNEEIIKEKMSHTSNITFKDVLLQDIVALNPSINETSLSFTIKKLVVSEDMPEYAKYIYKHTNDYFENWGFKTLKPCLDRYYNDFGIKISYRFN